MYNSTIWLQREVGHFPQGWKAPIGGGWETIFFPWKLVIREISKKPDNWELSHRELYENPFRPFPNRQKCSHSWKTTILKKWSKTFQERRNYEEMLTCMTKIISSSASKVLRPWFGNSSSRSWMLLEEAYLWAAGASSSSCSCVEVQVNFFILTSSSTTRYRIQLWGLI